MSALAMRRTWRNIALGLILATGLAAACGPEEPASPGDGHSSTSPTPTATAATESPTDPPPQGTPLPTPAPTPVPATPASRTPVPVTPEPTTIVGAPGDTLPAVSPSPGLEANVEAVGHWEPRFKGAMGDIVLLHRDGKDYALLGSAGEVHLLEIDASGEPTPGEAVLSLPGIVRALETDGELLAVVTGGDAALGLHLFDIADLRAPRALGSYGGDFLNVRLEADQAYLPAGRDGLHIVDIAEPNRLTRISRIEPWFEEAMPTEHNQPAILRRAGPRGEGVPRRVGGRVRGLRRFGPVDARPHRPVRDAGVCGASSIERRRQVRLRGEQRGHPVHHMGGRHP